jgi:hypothetical protein
MSSKKGEEENNNTELDGCYFGRSEYNLDICDDRNNSRNS